MDTKHYKHHPITVIKKTKRRSTSIKITPDNTITVVAPWNISSKKIDQIIQHHGKWIDKKIKDNENRPKAPSYTFEEGSTFPYLGKSYKVQFASEKKAITLNNHHLVISHPRINKLSRSEKQAQIEKWLKEKATDIMSDRVEIYAQKLGHFPKDIRFKKQKTRWGSCSSIGNLNFNYLLMLSSLEVIDYIVAHELCHLVHQNHSKSFWELVKSIYPDYKTHHRWLKENGHTLRLDP